MTSDERRRTAADDHDPPHDGSILRHDDHPGIGDHIGEAAGGISGVITGAALGAAGGPIGTIIGGIAGAVGGWWAGRTVSEAATRMTGGDTDTHYQHEYEQSSDRLADRGYDDVRPAYQLGHLAGINPEYHGRDFDAVESDLRHGWSDDVRARHGEWQSVRRYARAAYTASQAAAGAHPPAQPGAQSAARPDGESASLGKH